MAYEPIVLGSNLIPSSNQNIGALSNVYTNPYALGRDPTVENADGTFTVPTYQRTVIDIPDNFDFSMYGRAGPTLRYFNRVRTGEIEYDPNNDVVDLSTLEEGAGERNPNLPSEAEMIKQELIGVATQLAGGIGGQIGRSVASTVGAGDTFGLENISEGFTEFKDNFKFMDVIRSPKTGSSSKVSISPDTPLGQIAEQKAIIKAKDVTPEAKIDARDEIADIKAANPDNLGYRAGFKDRGKSFGKNSTAAGRANLYGSAGAGIATIAANLISGKNLKESVKTGAKVGVGTYVGTLIGGPIGGLVGGLLGGRVICNELMRQGIMTRKQVVLDYKFTRDYLTPTHVNGYHVWAVWMVKQMRKGRFVGFWKHVAGHRANEIAYIYGERATPDYLGKAYRKILEPICWSIGFFCKKTDWTVLYTQKEI